MTGSRVKDLTKLTKFLAMVLIALATFTLLFAMACNATLRNSDFRLSRVSQSNINARALVIGNSRGVNLIDPTLTSVTTFNLSYNGLTSASIFALARDFYRAGNTADTIIVEASGLLVPGANCELKPYWGILPELARASQNACRKDARMARWFPLTRYDTELFQRAVYYLINRRDQAWANESTMTRAACARPPAGQMDSFSRKLSIAQIARIRAEITGFRNWLATHHRSARVVFVLAPFFPAPETSGGIAAVRHEIDALLGAGNYLDLTRTTSRDCTLFADTLHLSRAGRDAVRGQVMAYALTQH